jgi:hypothetical protein
VKHTASSYFFISISKRKYKQNDSNIGANVNRFLCDPAVGKQAGGLSVQKMKKSRQSGVDVDETFAFNAR